jgi:hypothetical protein
MGWMELIIEIRVIDFIFLISFSSSERNLEFVLSIVHPRAEDS